MAMIGRASKTVTAGNGGAPNAPTASRVAAAIAPMPFDAKSAAVAESEAHDLAARLPSLLVEAMRVASTVSHGLHGRRRAGPGETFWQFRHYESTDAATLIDWRRSASSDQLYIREREWEAAHTFWLWANTSSSMDFRSDLASTTKRDRALVLMLAATELLVQGGERAALIGLTRPSASRYTVRRIAEAIAANKSSPVLTETLPPAERLSRFAGAVIISDFLDPPKETIARLEILASNGVTGHLIQVFDPAEETLPYTGRAEFQAPDQTMRWVVDRTETLRDAYIAKIQAHRAELTEHARRIGWTYTLHHTDQSPTQPLLSLILRLQNASQSNLASAASGGAI